MKGVYPHLFSSGIRCYIYLKQLESERVGEWNGVAREGTGAKTPTFIALFSVVSVRLEHGATSFDCSVDEEAREDEKGHAEKECDQ